jgi:hypothetical protein
MALPPPPTGAGPGHGPGHGPFGQAAFLGALVGSAVCVVLGVLMLLLADGALRHIGTALIVLGTLGLTTGGAGLLAERLLHRRPPPPPEVRAGNGHAPHSVGRRPPRA